MAAEIVKINPAHPERAFSRCRDVVSRGGVVVYPTDTFYGLGVDPKNSGAVERLFDIKGRQADQPILLLIDNAARVADWAAEVNDRAEHLMKTHWPGPLTLVFKAQKHVLPLLTGAGRTIGLRVPGNPLTCKLLEFINTPLTGTSANVSGERSVRRAEEAAEALGGRVDLVLDGGVTPGGKPSTVVDVSAGRVTVIREGAVKI